MVGSTVYSWITTKYVDTFVEGEPESTCPLCRQGYTNPSGVKSGSA
jgi:hypothetical protein